MLGCQEFFPTLIWESLENVALESASAHANQPPAWLVRGSSDWVDSSLKVSFELVLRLLASYKKAQPPLPEKNIPERQFNCIYVHFAVIPSIVPDVSIAIDSFRIDYVRLILLVCIIVILEMFFLFFFGKPAVHFSKFLLCCPSQRSARSQVLSQVAVSCELGRCRFQTRDCRTTVWRATIEPTRLPCWLNGDTGSVFQVFWSGKQHHHSESINIIHHKIRAWFQLSIRFPKATIVVSWDRRNQFFQNWQKWARHLVLSVLTLPLPPSLVVPYWKFYECIRLHNFHFYVLWNTVFCRSLFFSILCAYASTLLRQNR